ncbi:kinase-like domain-containing protein [Rhizophagus irregularis DAOM 181602=DAOM 197198]|nr:kinase-like domain-containing protein [Rhizophagus irregularis DAOM 181602=DAOM 197198]
MQLKINKWNDIIVEWIPYNQFNDIKEISRNDFTVLYSAIWKDGPLQHNNDERNGELKRIPDKGVALKCLCNSQGLINNEFLSEIKSYSIEIAKDDNIPDNFLNEVVKEFFIEKGRSPNIFGISQNPAIWIRGPLKYNRFYNKLLRHSHFKKVSLKYFYNLQNIIDEIKSYSINTFNGNILSLTRGYYSKSGNSASDVYISDMGLCGEVGNIDGNKIYGVMPYVAPEVLKGKPYTQAADIYSFALNICNGNRPKINENEAPKCYIDLMKRCWDSNPNNRPSAIEVGEFIRLFRSRKNEEIEKQFIEAEEYRKTNLLSVENIQSTTHHPQAYYTSRLLNSYTKDLSKYDNINNNSVEIVDFTMISADDEDKYK